MSQPSQPRSPRDSLPVAALGLGFYSRYLGTDCLQDCMVTLVDKIRTNVYTGIQHVIATIDQYFRDDPGAEISKYDVKAISQLADKALEPSDLLRWYELGAFLGDCELRASGRFDRTVVGEDPFNAEDLTKLISHMHRLPPAHVRRVRVLQTLFQQPPIASLSASSVANARLREAIVQSDVDLSTRFTSNENESAIITFHDAIVADLMNLDEHLIHPHPDDRDAWIYSRVLQGDAYPSIISELLQHPEWDAIVSVGGISAAAKRYALRQSPPLPLPPKRIGGRPRRRENQAPGA